MIDELLNGNTRRQLGETSDMIVVIVRDNQMINLPKAGIADRGHNPASIPDSTVATVPCINEDRFPGGCDKKHRISALHVDYINVQRVRTPSLCNGNRCENNGDQQKPDCWAHPSHPLSPILLSLELIPFCSRGPF